MALPSSDLKEPEQGLPESPTKTNNKRKWFILVAIGTVHFSSAICISLQAPFYPQEAEKKNATATEYGLVFGVFELASFICCPILGKHVDTIGAKLLLTSGMLTTGLASIVFGLLDLLETHLSFITLSFIVRIVEAIGSSAAVTSAFAITAAEFQDRVATIFSALEICYGIGFIVGPSIGGFLFEYGGYMLPFMVMGFILLMAAICIFFLLPNLKGDQPKIKMKEILKIPEIIIDSLSIMASSLCMGFYSASLEPHLRRFALSPVFLGLIFVISGGMYALSAPIVGRFCDNGANPKIIIIVGNCLTVASVFLVGPAPFFQFEASLPLVIVGLVLHGLGNGCILVSGFVDAIRSAVAKGYPEGIATYGLISGLWAASFSLGAFIGPSVSGVATDYFGFRIGSMFIVIVHVVIFCIWIVYLTCKARTRS